MAKKKGKKRKPRRRLNFSQIVFIGFGILIILSMVLSLVPPF